MEVVLPRPDIWTPDYRGVGERLRLPKWAKPWERSVEKEAQVVAAIAVGNSWGSNAATNSVAQTISGVQTGELLVCISLCFGSSSFTVNNPTDNGAGSSWATRVDTGYVTRSRVTVADTIVGATPPTSVTASASGSCSAIATCVFRVTGAAGSGSVYDNSVGDGQVSATPATGALTTVNANDLLIVGLTHDGATTSLTQPTGFSAGPINTSASVEPYCSGYEGVSAIQTAATYQFTLGASRNAVMVAAAYKAASAAAAIDPPGYRYGF
jgi:hypothetical protein